MSEVNSTPTGQQLACPYQPWRVVQSAGVITGAAPAFQVIPVPCIGPQCSAFKPATAFLPAACAAHSAGFPLPQFVAQDQGVNANLEEVRSLLAGGQS